MQKFHADPDLRLFRDYRNAIMHGYSYPISSKDGKILLKSGVRAPKFSFSNMTIDSDQFFSNSFAKVDRFICGGWRCFETDELT